MPQPAVRLLDMLVCPNSTAPVAAPTTAAICQLCQLSDDARSLTADELGPLPFFKILFERRLYADALRFLAYYLPPRQAIWWGCLCVWYVSRPELSEKSAAALQTTFHWALDPSEENRRAAYAAGNAAGAGTPAGALAVAVFLSGGSLSLPWLPEVAPKPFLTAKTVASAVLAASRQAKAQQVAEFQHHFLVMGYKIARGQNL